MTIIDEFRDAGGEEKEVTEPAPYALSPGAVAVVTAGMAEVFVIAGDRRQHLTTAAVGEVVCGAPLDSMHEQAVVSMVTHDRTQLLVLSPTRAQVLLAAHGAAAQAAAAWRTNHLEDIEQTVQAGAEARQRAVDLSSATSAAAERAIQQVIAGAPYGGPPPGIPNSPGTEAVAVAVALAAELRIDVAKVDIVAAQQAVLHDNADIQDVCERLGVPLRPVALAEGWWRQGQATPLLLQLADGRVIALVPRHRGRLRQLTTPPLPDTLEDPQTMDIARAFACYVSAGRSRLGWPLAFRLIRGSGSLSDVGMILAAVCAAALIAGLFPVATGILLGNVATDTHGANLAAWGVALTVAAIVSYVLAVLSGRLVLRLVSRLDLQWTAAMWHRLLQLRVPFLRKWAAGELAERIFALDAVKSALVAAVTVTMTAAAAGAVATVILLSISMTLTMMMLVLFVVVIAILTPCVIGVLRAEGRLINAQVSLNGLVVDLFQGISKIRVAGAEHRAEYVWANGYASFTRNLRASMLFHNGMSIVTSAFAGLATVVLFIGLADAGSQGVGAYATAASAVAMLAGSLSSFTSVAAQIAAAKPALTTVEPILDAAPESTGGVTAPALTGKVELRSVTFGYDHDVPIIRNLSLTVHPGEYVAIVGPSGAGKSTLVALLLAFERPWKGSVLYDDTDLSRLNPDWVRRQIGVVLQDIAAPDSMLLGTILAGRPFGEDEAWRAAEAAGIADEIRTLPMGMNTIMLSQAGMGFSGGQLQRILLARALVGTPKILILDEATSALDNVTQARVCDSLARMGLTRIVIAHRLSTIVDADRIVVVDGGRIVQEGNYDSLINTEGPFQRLAQRQLA